MKNIENAIVLHRSTMCEEQDICVDGVYYGLDYTDASDRAMLQILIEENNLEIKDVPFWNSCDKTKDIGFKKIVYVDADNAYLINNLEE